MDTIIANSRFFDHDISKVPKTAVTVGVQTIMNAREVIIKLNRKVLLLVNGSNKAVALSQGVEGPVSQQYTISALQMHPRSVIGNS